MRRVLLTIACCAAMLPALADHITGGSMSYAYLGSSGSSHNYAVTLKLFMRCNSGRQFPDPAIVSIFNKQTGTRVMDLNIPVTQRETLQLIPNDPCITDPPTVCYELAYYTFTINLPSSTSGFIIASEVNYRIRGIANISSEQVGATYTADIPATNPVASGPANSSAVFTGSDLVVVCADNPFTYNFGASDGNGDRIRYTFCAAYNSTNAQGNNNPPGPPPYEQVNYVGAFSAQSPLGNRVTIDPNTGVISGIAPPAGIYVVTVCAEEIRDNQVIAVQRKDLQINITDCSIASATLEDEYMLCRNSRQLSVRNLSNSPLIVTWNWSVIDPGGNTIFTSTSPVLDYNFATDGRYSIKLVVNRNQPCSDSTTAPVFVFPGMNTQFDFAGVCFGQPTSFTDRSTLRTGSLVEWAWDFGEPAINIDVSDQRNPVFTYPTLGNKRVQLSVLASNGCRDTAIATVAIITKPPIQLGFTDSLICRNDLVTLQAAGNGQFSWTPAAGMAGSQTGSPTVSPGTTTRYYVTLDAGGNCINTDSVLIRVVDRVTLLPMADTVICRGDSARLQIVSDGLQYQWTPVAQVLTPGVPDPWVITNADTRYSVTAIIGGCSANASIWVRTVPYPQVFAGEDTTICYNTPAFLRGTTNGSLWNWAPAGSLTQSTALQPVAYPPQTTSYVLTALAPASGCPKPSFDTVLVTVFPRIIPIVGNDTSVLVGQPLQLQASGGVSYLWAPSTHLDNPSIANPVAIFPASAEAFLLSVNVYNELGCYETAAQEVKVFAIPPTVFVPTGFTPNEDGLNDRLLPIAVGMREIRRFSVYNRWGQLVFSTNRNGHGWDGRVNGQLQASNTYVWWVEATDYLGKPYFLKGHSTLIR